MNKKSFILFALFFISVFAIRAQSGDLDSLNIPPRDPVAKTGSEFMQFVINMSFEQREAEILNEIQSGNIPDFLRSLKNIESQFSDANGVEHSVVYQVMPDYLAIGSDEDFCRIPMGPITAQHLADLFGAIMPTRKLVDDIYFNCSVKLPPVTYAPVGNQNSLVPKFIQHNHDIDSLFVLYGGVLGELTGGTKKDVVISNKITDPNRPNHVVIYGWHQLNGQPIQPLSNIHINSYVDYSHGIRFLNDDVLIDGEIMTIKDILTDDILYKILSDETGPMEQPSYLPPEGLPDKPKSFGVKTGGSNSLELIIESDENVDSYLVFLSSDGINFNSPLELTSSNLIINGLEEEQVYFLKIKSKNSVGESAYSEVLAGITSANLIPQVLIVNGFDRTSEGNTFNFIRQHANAVINAGVKFCSASNEAVIAGLFGLYDYTFVDYILGDESTLDETFNAQEQSLISGYLQNGGNLFVSGSEIAWDLDYKGSSSDKYFIWNYLKCAYVSDAPNNQSNTFYSAEALDGTVFSAVGQFSFDDGTHGTINVDWPDVLNPQNGSDGFLKYTGLNTSSGYAGVLFGGLFSDGTENGKIITMGLPFETIYPETKRNSFMVSVLQYFGVISEMNENASDEQPSKFELFQNYPNPFNPSTTIQFAIPKAEMVSLIIYNLLGEKVATLINENKEAGKYEVKFNAGNLSSGMYIYRIQAGEFVQTKKLLLLK